MIDEARLYRLRFFGNRAGLEGAIDRLRKVHDKLASGTASRVTVFALDAEEARLALALAHQSPKANGGQCRRRAADLAEKLIARAEAWNHRLRIAEAHLLAAIAKPDQCRAHLAAFASLREELGFRLLDGPQALTTYDIDPVAQRRW